MRYAIVDGRITDEIALSLGRYADKLIKLPPSPLLAAPVASHPDMLLWTFGRYIVTPSHYAKLAPEVFDELERAGFEIIQATERISAEYPHDVALNCAAVGKHLIANTRSMSQSVREIADRHGLITLNTKQGYAKCSSAVVSDNALITADKSIYVLAKQNGLDALLIEEGHVRLDGYGYGFIGGASGTAEDSVLFCGNLSLHPDGEKIAEFCKSHNKVPISLSSEPLYDYGTVMLWDTPT